MVPTTQQISSLYFGREWRGRWLWLSNLRQTLSQLHLASCAYEPGHKSELMLHLSKGDHWLTPHPLLLEAPAVSLFAVILRVAGGRATTECSDSLAQQSLTSYVCKAVEPAAHPCSSAAAASPCAMAHLCTGMGGESCSFVTCIKMGLFQMS